jgi:hypothetical protein
MSEKGTQRYGMQIQRVLEEINKDEGFDLEPRLGIVLVAKYFSIQTNISQAGNISDQCYQIYATRDTVPCRVNKS